MEEAHSGAQICAKPSWRRAPASSHSGVIPLSELSVQPWSWVFYSAYRKQSKWRFLVMAAAQSLPSPLLDLRLPLS